jgi:signal transduction histidine kinase
MTRWCLLPDMRTTPNSPNKTSLNRQYAAALLDYLRDEGETSLHRAYQLGRQAVSEGKPLLEMIELHHRAFCDAASGLPATMESQNVIEAAGAFLVEAMSPYEMTNRAFGEASTALGQVNEKLENEAKRIAQALHDDAGQFLAAVHIQLENIAHTQPVEVREQLYGVRRLLDRIEDQLRGLAHELCPPALGGGLLSALRTLAVSVSRRTGLRVIMEGTENSRPPVKIEAALYRVVQEALTNATRHAQPKAIRVKLWYPPGLLRCCIEDDGRGFDPKLLALENRWRGLGLTSMKERLQAVGGNYEIHSAPGQGTRIEVCVPLER